MEKRSSMIKYFILQHLSAKQMTGYEVIAEIRNITGKLPSTSQVYPVLNTMKKSGYLTATDKFHGKRKIKIYKLTSSGKTLFSVIERQFESMIRAMLSNKIRVCAHCNCEILKGHYSKITHGKKLDFCCTACAGSFK
ncbi:MAG: PadR family transcriptional regulator [Candidatus Aenigmarchaeota archaeon]|nr:PadR family transcriptional regulator [Candidatus Aenigmarchaeota archaeon]